MLSEESISQIRKLRKDGKTLREIGEAIGCASTVVYYHLNNKNRRRVLWSQHGYRKGNPLVAKLQSFTRVTDRKKRTKFDRVNPDNITAIELFKQLSENPYCYLTGDKIDLKDSRSYQLDHKIPRSRGGKNELKNLGLSTSTANKAKHDLTPDEFLKFCIKVVSHAGYIVKSKYY